VVWVGSAVSLVTSVPPSCAQRAFITGGELPPEMTVTLVVISPLAPSADTGMVVIRIAAKAKIIQIIVFNY
jgi:hypothetical protein